MNLIVNKMQRGFSRKQLLWAGSLVLILVCVGVAFGLRGAIAGLVINGWTSRAPGDSLEQGLVGHWTFDGPDTDWGTNTTNDTSGNGNTGTLTNMSTTTSPTAGVLGQAMKLDGTNDYIEVPASASLEDIETQGGGGMTVSAWVYVPSGGLDQVLVSKGYGYWRLEINSGGQLSFTVSFSGTDLYAYSEQVIVPNRWQHVVVTWDGGMVATSSVTFHVDTEVIEDMGSDVDGAGVRNTDAGQALLIGYDENITYLDGDLDDVRIYNRALSADEVKALYNQGGAKIVVNSRPGATPLTEGLVGYWPMDPSDIVATTAPATTTDRSGNGNDGTIYGAATSTGKIGGGGMSFDGVDDVILLGDQNIWELAPTERMAISLWVKPSSLKQEDIFGRNNGDWTTADWTWNIVADSGDLYFGMGDGVNYDETYANSYPISLNQWTHIVVSVGEQGESVDLYADGMLHTSVTRTSGQLNQTANDFQIGGEEIHFFDGSIDDVRVYNRALSPKEVADLYALESSSHPDTSLVSHWTFDGPDTNVPAGITRDRGFGGNTGGITGAAPTPGINGQGMGFDGVDDVVHVAGHPSHDNLDVKTISAWIKPGDFNEWRGIAGRATYAFQICNNDGTDCPGTYGRLVYYHVFSGTNGKWILGADSITVNQWSHVVVTYDRTSTANKPTLYVNGVAQSATEISTPTGTADSEYSELYIGYDGYALATGAIDDVRIYNRALSATEIADLYQSSAPKLIVNASMNNRNTDGLVGLWSFDGPNIEWGSNTAEDSSGSGNDGVLTNMSTTTSGTIGKIGQALKFDGTNDYLSVGTGPSSVKTVAFWAKPNSTTESIMDLDGTRNIAISSGTVQGNNFSSPAIYVDGVQTSTFPDTNWHFVTITTATAIDADSFNIGKVSTSYYDGLLDDVRLYDHVLTQAEIQQLHLLGR